MDNKITTDDLRGMLDKYSPEQQMEIDIQAIREVSKSLSDAVPSLEKSLAIIPSLAEKLAKTTKIELSETARNEIIAIGESIGKSAAQAFRKEVEPVIKKAQRRTDYISIPAPAYYCLILLLLALFGFALAICTANYALWGNIIIWKITGILSVGFTLLSVITLFLFHKGWLS
jgi:hypothetical protein